MMHCKQIKATKIKKNESYTIVVFFFSIGTNLIGFDPNIIAFLLMTE